MKNAKKKKTLAAWLVIGLTVSAASSLQANDCSEYYVSPSDDNQLPRITTICHTDSGVEMSYIELEEGDSRIIDQNQHSTEQNNSASGENNSTDATNTADGSAEQTSAAKTPDGTNEQSVQLDKYRTGSASERLKYVGIKFWSWFWPWLSRYWYSLLILGLVAATTYFAYRAWRTAREDAAASKKANALSQKPYFVFEDAKAAWHSQVPYFKPCVGFNLRIKNTGQSVALNLSPVTMNKVIINFNQHYVATLDEEKIAESTDVILCKSKEIKDDVDEASVTSSFPSSDVARAVVNPNEVVEFFVSCPMKDVPASGDSDTTGIRCMAWLAEGSFSFIDSFSSEKRVVDFQVQWGATGLTTFGDGTSMTTGNGAGKVAAGKLTENLEKA